MISIPTHMCRNRESLTENYAFLDCLQLPVSIIRKTAIASLVLRTKNMGPESGSPLIPIEWVSDSGVYSWQIEKNFILH